MSRSRFRWRRANAALVAHFTAAPDTLMVQQRDAALAALNSVAGALLLQPADLVTPAMLD